MNGQIVLPLQKCKETLRIFHLVEAIQKTASVIDRVEFSNQNKKPKPIVDWAVAQLIYLAI